jgi:hypothetical protein
MVGRNVGVNVGRGVFVATGVSVDGVPVDEVVVGSRVLSTKRSGVFVGSSEKGVGVETGGRVGVDVPRKGIDTGSPLQPERRKMRIRTGFNFFIIPLQ